MQHETHISYKVLSHGKTLFNKSVWWMKVDGKNDRDDCHE